MADEANNCWRRPYYPGKDLEALCSEMRSYIDRGYGVAKMKIGGADLAEDRRRIEAALAEIGSDAEVAVDPHGRFDLETALPLAQGLPDLPLFRERGPGGPP